MLNSFKRIKLSNFRPHQYRTIFQRPRYVRFEVGPGGGNPGNNKRPGGGFFDSRTWPMKVGLGLGGAGVVYYVAHLEQVPETGRYRFINVGPAMEAQLGEMTRQQTYQEFRGKIVPPDHPVSKHVRRVVTQILSASNLGVVKGLVPVVHSPFDDTWDPDASSDFSRSDPALGGQREWDVIVVNDKIVNAAATPGTIIVFTGILPVCKDETGLAAVLSHEIAHVVARHSAERLSSQAVAIAFMILLTASGLDMGISSFLHSLLVDLPNSRTQEREADIIGLRLMSKACYDPKGAPEMFSRLGELESKMSRLPEFMTTHPLSTSRVKYLEELLPQAYEVLAASPDCSRIRDQATAFRDLARIRAIGNPTDREEVW
ncbi:peptidase m48 family protein [Moniliophthora roreri MCA 2997]|uniref:Peptidase m48 family protein n=1 Tax=Moniliophthora roreri (strain MCA 2997) TaxID=1381753 RepID=V2WPJ8_MONRO|nr:peptidase m48 family protein [Moniliophthora roreri MCA 2997]